MAKRFNGEGSIRQRSNGSWEARYTNPLTQKQSSLYAKTKAEINKKLKEKLKELDAEREKQNNLTSTDITLDEWFYIYMNRYKRNRIKPQTFSQYQSQYINNIQPYIGNMRLVDITSGNLEDVVNHMAKNKSKDTIKNVMTNLSNCFSKAIGERYITTNPAQTVDYNIGRKSMGKEALQEQELLWFFRGLKEHYPNSKFMFQLMLSTGIRVGELVSLRWNNVGDDYEYITIKETATRYHDYDTNKYIKTYCSPKTNNIRTIPVMDELKPQFKMYKESLLERYEIKHASFTENDFVFQKPIKKPYTQVKVQQVINHVLAYVEEEYDIHIKPFTPHYLRHTFATIALHSNIPIIDIQKIGGWSSTKMLYQVYGHTNQSILTEAVNNMEIPWG